MSGDSSLGIGIGLALKSYGRALTYVGTDRALDLGNLEPFTIPDLSGNANTATLYTGIYVSTNGTTDKAIGANATALGSGNYYLSGKIKPAGTTAKTTMDGSTASNLTGLTAGVWQDFQTATASAITPSSINLGWDGTAFNATVDNWSDVKLHDASDDSVVAHWKLYDSADASLDGYPALDCVGGFHGTYTGCAGGSGEASILQTAGEDFNKRMWFAGAGSGDYINCGILSGFTSYTEISISLKFAVSDNTSRIISILHSGGDDIRMAVTSAGALSIGVDDGTSFDLDFGAGFNDGMPHTASLTLNGDGLSATVDGTTLTNGSATFNFGTGNGLCLIGSTSSAPGNNLAKGLIYDVEISNQSGATHSWIGNGNTDAAWTDQVGSNDGTVNGSPSLYHVAESETTAGQDALGTAIENPRPNDRVLNLTTGTGYAEVADSASLDLTTEATWELWGNFYRNTGDPDFHFLSKWDNNLGDNRSWWFRNDDETGEEEFQVGLFTNGSPTNIYNAWFDIPNSVACVIITLSEGVVKPYVNGTEVSFNATSGTPSSVYVSGTPVMIGAAVPNNPSGLLKVQLGDIRIYNRALTADEVLKNYNARKGAYGL